MSILYRLIHDIFFTNSLRSSRTSLLSTRTFASTTSLPSQKFKSVLDRELLKERDLRMLVDRFKHLCNNSAYRDRGYVTYIEVIRRLAVSYKFLWIEEIFEDQKKYCVSNPVFAERFIEFYGKAGMFEHARKMFDEMPQLSCNRTVKTFNILLHACVQCEKYSEFRRIFREVPEEMSITPDVVSYNISIKAYSKMGSVADLLQTMEKMEISGLKPDSIAYGSLLLGLYQNGEVSEAEKIWESLPSKGIAPCIRCYTSKVMHLVTEKRLTEAVKLFEEMESNGISPDKYAFSALFKGFCENRNLEEAKDLYQKMKKNKCRMNEYMYEMLVQFASGMGDFGFARDLCLASIKERSFLGQGTLQEVVDGLMGQSKFKEAEQLVVLIQGSSNPVYIFYGL